MGLIYYWHLLGTETKIQPSRQARGGGIMVWDGICCDNKTDLVILKGEIDLKSYQTCLNHQFKAENGTG